MKSRRLSNNLFLLMIIGFLLISLISVNDVFGAQTVNNRIVITDEVPTASDDLFGYHIENIGDLNNDGVVDLAVTKFADNTGLTDVGSILILFMNSDGSIESTNEITMEDNLTNGIGDVCLDDTKTQLDTFGLEQLVFVGDLDGDGKPTIALGSPESRHDISNDATSTGAIYMLELLSTGKVDNCLRIVSTGDGTGENGFNPAASVYNVNGTGIESELGRVLVATDVNGDGQNELIAGAQSVGNTSNTDDLWVMFLTTTGAVDSFVQITATEIGLTFDVPLNDGAPINGDNKFVVGSTGEDGTGSIFILTVSETGAFSSSKEINGDSLGQGIIGSDDFGRGVTSLGDMDGDGVSDILVGNIAGDDINVNSGEVYILFMNSDDSVKESQKISNDSENARTGTAPFEGGDVFGNGMALWIDSGGQAVIAIGAHQDDTESGNAGAMYLFYIERTSITVTKKGGGGCDDCTPPTLGVNSHGERMVDGGFNYNGNIVDVKHFHTEFPLINATVGELNSVQVKIYENGGIANNKWVQFGLGVKQVRDPVNDSEVIVLVNLHYNGTAVESIDIVDKENLIENDSVFATVYPIKCKILSNNEDCILVSLIYSYREAPRYNIMLVNTVDDKRNSWNFYFNDGIKVIGKSLNEPPTSKQFFKNASQDKDVWYTLTRTDKINDIWTDQNGIEYQNNNGAFDRITPYEPWTCNDPPLEQLNVPTRKNCNFRALTSIWG